MRSCVIIPLMSLIFPWKLRCVFFFHLCLFLHNALPGLFDGGEVRGGEPAELPLVLLCHMRWRWRWRWRVFQRDSSRCLDLDMCLMFAEERLSLSLNLNLALETAGEM